MQRRNKKQDGKNEIDKVNQAIKDLTSKVKRLRSGIDEIKEELESPPLCHKVGIPARKARDARRSTKR